MRFTDLLPAYQHFLQDLLGRCGFDPTTFHMEIPTADEMFYGSVLPGYPNRPDAAFFRYVESTLRTYDVYRQISDHLGGFDGLTSVLDFGSGWGRLTRALTHRLPHHKIWISDLYPEAVAWQAETFSVNGLVSVTHPDKFALQSRFSIVFAASVFSHLPDALFQGWLKRLYALIEPNGLLAFSVHDASFSPDGGSLVGLNGISYDARSESASHDPLIYGMSYVSEEYVRKIVNSNLGPETVTRRFPRALFESQDLYVIGGPEVGLEALQITVPPLAGFAPVEADRSLIGWGLEPTPGESILTARLFTNDACIATTSPSGERTDLLRFFPGSPNVPVRWEFDAPSERNTVLRVELTSSTGRHTNAYAAIPTDAGSPSART